MSKLTDKERIMELAKLATEILNQYSHYQPKWYDVKNEVNQINSYHEKIRQLAEDE